MWAVFFHFRMISSDIIPGLKLHSYDFLTLKQQQ